VTKAKRKGKAKTKTKTKAKTKTRAKTKKRPGRAPARGKTQPKAAKPTPRRSPSALRTRALAIVAGLEKEHPEAHCELDFGNALELLVATILSAQCTDARVNMVTKDLFRRYPKAKNYIAAPVDVFEDEIRSTGFFRNKTKAIKEACESIVEKFGGDVPHTMEGLLRLPGVGRKTANVILANVFGVPGIVVDTHMLRLSRRMGLTDETDPAKVEQALMEILPPETWISLSRRIPWHGRRVCTARKPACDVCAVAHLCPKLL
jgi:endonuclease-3